MKNFGFSLMLGDVTALQTRISVILVGEKKQSNKVVDIRNYIQITLSMAMSIVKWEALCC